MSDCRAHPCFLSLVLAFLVGCTGEIGGLGDAGSGGGSISGSGSETGVSGMGGGSSSGGLDPGGGDHLGGSASSGGTSTGGGAPIGGSASGGMATGGTATGGSASGGTATGGTATGGNGTGGSDGPDPCIEGEIIPCKLEPLPTTGDPYQDCVNRINQFRSECACLPPLERWTEAESCSNEQSQLDATSGGAHGNFGMCGESAQDTCPGWGGGTEAIINDCLQSMWDEGPGGGHHDIMSSDRTHVACGFYTMEDGSIWANQNFK